MLNKNQTTHCSYICDKMPNLTESHLSAVFLAPSEQDILQLVSHWLSLYQTMAWGRV